MEKVREECNYANMTGTTTVHLGSGSLLGIFVASASAVPTIKVSDGTQTIVNTFVPTGPGWYPIPAHFSTSLIITISGTVDCTAFWNP
jgi:hypothetical protein